MTRLQISRFSAAGEGFAHDEGGQAWLVPGALVGDEVSVSAQQDRKGLRVATQYEWLTQGSERVASFCPVERCGGCGWRELDLNAAHGHKRARVIEALERIARLDVSVGETLAAPGIHYRHRARLHVAHKRVGYHERGSKAVVPFSSCAVLLPGFVERLAPLALALSRNPEIEGELEVLFSPDGNRLVVEFTTKAKVAEKMSAFIGQQVEQKRVEGAIFVSPAAKQKVRRFGEPHVLLRHPQYADGPAKFFLEPGVFSQANLAGNALLVAHVREMIPAGARVLEWHAGAGNLTLAYADKASEVIASEWDEQAVMCARRNVEAHGMAKRVKVVKAADKDVPLGQASLLLLDPPRIGAKEACERVAAAPEKLERIVYVSCDPASLARDLLPLQRSFKLVKVTPLDMFAGTPHVECVAVLDRK